MKILRYTAAALMCLMITASCAAETAQNENTDAAPEPTRDPVTLMSDEEKAAQVLLTRCGENSEEQLRAGVGGIVMFGADFEGLSADEVCAKTAAFRECAEIAPIIAVDEEGGTVVRISSNPQLRSEPFASPMEYMREGGMDLINEINAEKAQLLVSLGVNMNLAPVCDISAPGSFMYERTLGCDADTTAEYVRETVRVSKENGLMSCLKHFPGYGSVSDTHTGSAVDERAFSEFEETDFKPFEAGSDSAAILVSHNIVTCMDSEVPASISAAVHEIIRDKIGFENLIITDDMSMGAMEGYENAYVRAVNSGNDMLIVSDFDTAYNQIFEAIGSGEISEETINRAVRNILRVKEEL